MVAMRPSSPLTLLLLFAFLAPGPGRAAVPGRVIRSYRSSPGPATSGQPRSWAALARFRLPGLPSLGELGGALGGVGLPTSLSGLQSSLLSSSLHLQDLGPASNNVKVTDIIKILDTPAETIRRIYDRLNNIAGNFPKDLEKEKTLKYISQRLPDTLKLHETINNAIDYSSNATSDVLRKLNSTTQQLNHLPSLYETLNKTRKFMTEALIPSLLYKYQPKPADGSGIKSYMNSFYLSNYLKNASANIKRIQIPQLPSVNQIIDKSIIPSIEPKVLNSIFNVERIKFIRKTLDKLSWKNDYFTEVESRNEENTSTPLPTENGNIITDAPLVSPMADLAALVAASRLLPRLLPLLLQDYKTRLGAWLLGTRVRSAELGELYTRLLHWNGQLTAAGDSTRLPAALRRLASTLQQNNIGLLNLVLHLMVRAEQRGSTTLTSHDLQLVDKYLIRPEQLFPGIGDILQ